MEEKLHKCYKVGGSNYEHGSGNQSSTSSKGLRRVVLGSFMCVSPQESSSAQPPRKSLIHYLCSNLNKSPQNSTLWHGFPQPLPCMCSTSSSDCSPNWNKIAFLLNSPSDWAKDKNWACGLILSFPVNIIMDSLPRHTCLPDFGGGWVTVGYTQKR